jgi:hypothetical protein
MLGEGKLSVTDDKLRSLDQLRSLLQVRVSCVSICTFCTFVLVQQVKHRRQVAVARQVALAVAGAQVICFTSKKVTQLGTQVQILTQLAGCCRIRTSAHRLFTGFTSTKVQILTQLAGCCRIRTSALRALHFSKTISAPSGASTTPPQVRSFLALLVQTYK